MAASIASRAPATPIWACRPGWTLKRKITAKPNAPEVLAAEIGAAQLSGGGAGLGTNTDPYQPIESKLGITRGCLQVLHDWNHPVALVTRGATVMRDADLLGAMAAKGQATVGVSITTLDADLARQMEPRAPAPATRLRMIRGLADAGVPVRVMVAPVIPVLTGHEIERILQAARDAGAMAASMIPLRLPHEVAPLFRDWLERHHPGKAAHVMSQVQPCAAGATMTYPIPNTRPF